MRSEREVSDDITYMWSLKRHNTNGLIYKTNRLTDEWLPGWEGIVREFRTDTYTLLYLK